MERKNLIMVFGLLIGALIALFVYGESRMTNYGLATSTNGNVFLASGTGGGIGLNLSGVILLNATFTDINATQQNNVVNVTFSWNRSYNSPGAYLNSTIHNTSANQSTFTNASFNTALLPDGDYNLTIWFYNISGNGNLTANITIDIIIDNTKPNISIQASVNTSISAELKNLTHGGIYIFFANNTPSFSHYPSFGLYNQNSTLNFSIQDNNSNRNGINSVANVTIYVENSTEVGTITRGFNITANNNSGFWAAPLNLSTLTGGNHSIKVFVADYAGNYNTTGVLFSFFVNTPLNVTWRDSTSGENTDRTDMNFSSNSSDYNFNASITNYTRGPANKSVSTVIFMFDNATGNDFNITLTDSVVGGNGAEALWNLTFNVKGRLAEGNHTVKVFVNDTWNNFNNTESFNFSVDISAPLVIFNVSNNAVTGNLPGNLSRDGLYVFFSNGTKSDKINRTFNFTIYDNSNINGLAQVSNVTIYISNSSADSTGAYLSGFNISAVNQSGHWVAQLNISMLKGGEHVVKVFAVDYFNNWNITAGGFTFTTNYPVNTTWVNNASDVNYSITSGNVNLSVLITNQSPSWVGTNTTSAFIFMFNNATGTDFNVTVPQPNGTGGAFGGATLWNWTYNVSNLEEGEHIVTVFVNDSVGNYNNTEKINFTIDKTEPTITVTCDNEKVVGQTVSCSCVVSDALTGIKLDATFYGSGSASESTTASAQGTFTSSTCAATDYSNNLGTGSGSFTIGSSSTGGSGTGGSGGGTSTTISGQSGKTIWSSLYAGESALVPISNGAIGVTQVSFSVKETSYGAWVEVKTSDDFPSTVGAFEGKVYRKLEIDKSVSLVDEVIDNAKIKFKVEKAWLSDNSLKSADIALYRFIDGRWTSLPTTMGEDDETYIHYTAVASGFSYFVIGQKEGVVAEPVAEQVEEASVVKEVPVEATPTEAAPVAEEGFSSLSVVIVVLIVLAILVVAWILFKKK